MLIPLRNYSNYSICESNIKIEDLVNFAEKEKLPAMALTDYKLLSGALEFSTKCKNKGIQPIIGLDVDYISKLNHKSRLTFLCKNEIGFKNLNILSTNIDSVENFLSYLLNFELWNNEIRYLTSMPYSIKLNDIVFIVSISLFSSLVASYIPILRIFRIKPNLILR